MLNLDNFKSILHNCQLYRQIRHSSGMTNNLFVGLNNYTLQGKRTDTV